jgi:hypothetical protein
VTFVTPDGDRTTLQVREGDSLLDIAHEHDIDLEGIVSDVLSLTVKAHAKGRWRVRHVMSSSIQNTMIKWRNQAMKKTTCSTWHLA